MLIKIAQIIIIVSWVLVVNYLDSVVGLSAIHCSVIWHCGIPPISWVIFQQIRSISKTGCEPETSDSGTNLSNVLKSLDSIPRPKKLIEEVEPGSFTVNGSLPERRRVTGNRKNSGNSELSHPSFGAKDKLQGKVLTGEDASLVGQLETIVPPSEREKVSTIIIPKSYFNYQSQTPVQHTFIYTVHPKQHLGVSHLSTVLEKRW